MKAAPLSVTVPLGTPRRPSSVRRSSRVVLPAPLGPITASTSPGATAAETPLRMRLEERAAYQERQTRWIRDVYVNSMEDAMTAGDDDDADDDDD